ncbi:MAG TPA: T9SS type A sorting domain-containing protein [Candidatus Kapabacteria bacterium]|nr:T9SS type A sorting domain-containing protein [Candidatus Kapabacteria bacterium]
MIKLVRIGLFLALCVISSTAFATVDTIKFGGPVLQYTYVPASLEVKVGDTIVWTGDKGSHFTDHPLASTAVPSGADAFSYGGTEVTFMYIVKMEGNYKYKCTKHVDMGMVGSFFTAGFGSVADNGSMFTFKSLVPNPVTSKTAINFSLDHSAPVSVKLLSVDGKEVATILNATVAEGDHSIPFNASSLATGTYIVVLEAEGVRQTKQMVVTK